jgi:type III pantothenate kinase
MILLVDVGNTNSVFGLADRESGAITATWRLSSNRERTGDEWYSLLVPHVDGAEPVTDAIVASVVPAITRNLAGFFTRMGIVDPLLVSAGLDLGIEIAVDAPAEVGADRLVNAAHGYARFGGPLIVVDLGTATKIEAITAGGTYLGGVIAPGLSLSLDALASRAARLYAVELRPPAGPIGRNTVAAVQSGVVLGHLAMIEGMVARVESELGKVRQVVLTGGYADAIAGHSALFTEHVPNLTLDGLSFLYRRNRTR